MEFISPITNTPTSLQAYRDSAAGSLRDLELVNDRGALSPGTIPLIAVVKNERTLIEAFLAHYRFLGVRRFMIVDNGSNDGTFEILSAAKDVDLWRTTASYAASHYGGLWIDGLLHARASERWILSVDSDEFLVFAGMKRNALKRLVAWLEFRGENRLFAPLLDVYSDRPIAQTIIRPREDPLKVCNWFDSKPENIMEWDGGKIFMGGPRQRLFFPGEHDNPPNLNKYPLLRYDRETAFVTVHRPTPFAKNGSVPYGRLLHAKLHAEFAERAKIAVAEKEHWQEAVEYRRYDKIVSENPQLSCYYEGSRKFNGPDSLLKAELMYDLRPTFAERKARLFERAASAMRKFACKNKPQR